MPLVLCCRNIHEVVELLEELTGEEVHNNKVYQAIKRNTTYKGFRFSYTEKDNETNLRYVKFKDNEEKDNQDKRSPSGTKTTNSRRTRPAQKDKTEAPDKNRK